MPQPLEKTDGAKFLEPLAAQVDDPDGNLLVAGDLFGNPNRAALTGPERPKDAVALHRFVADRIVRHKGFPRRSAVELPRSKVIIGGPPAATPGAIQARARLIRKRDTRIPPVVAILAERRRGRERRFRTA